MTALGRTVSLGLILLAAGCGSPPPAAQEKPLTVEQWKALPTQLKYEIDTLERLKQGTPKLQEPREWDRFTRDVVLPAKKKEMSGQPTGG
jgi:hypothetical protein